MKSVDRKHLTDKQTKAMRDAQDDLCACGCGQLLAEKIIREHTIPNFFVPGKPDALWRKDCATVKTKKDLADIARCKRRAGVTGQAKRRKERGYSLIKGRGFQGHKRFNGEIVWRRP